MRRTTSEVGGITGPLAGGPIAVAANPGVPFLAAAPLLVLAAALLLFVAKETLGLVPREIPPRETIPGTGVPPPS